MRFRRSWSFATALLFLAAAGLQAEQDAVLIGRVSRVTDGDTIRVTLASGDIAVRLDGIDAPESAMAGGPEARAALASFVMGRQVELRVQTQDRYERLVAVVVADGVNVNERMVVIGHAWAYRQYLRADTRHLCQLEDDARRDGLGLWSLPQWIYPPEWRKATRSKSLPRARESESAEACIAAAGQRS